jgi:hypothetical protein
VPQGSDVLDQATTSLWLLIQAASSGPDLQQQVLKSHKDSRKSSEACLPQGFAGLASVGPWPDVGGT